MSDKYDTVNDAISFYEKNMRQRASIAAKESLENGERMHSKNALTTMLAFFSETLKIKADSNINSSTVPAE